MKKTGLIAIILIVVIGLAVAYGISTYNSMVTAQTTVEQKASDIDTQLQRRADLIPNLVSSVKGYAAHEEAVFTAVTQAREQLMNADSMAEKSAANNTLTTALGRLLAVAEAYPELKADKVFNSLIDELSGTENRISYAREEYNAAVSAFNQMIRRFPASIIANFAGFKAAEFFAADSTATAVPTVSFEG
ncbi:MAG: LemA family protein [Clostridia bacterium]|nr:LemA family protein [Clostridia bacterium]